LRDGDRVRINLDEGSIDLVLADGDAAAELEQRLAVLPEWSSEKRKGIYGLYTKLAGPAGSGAGMEF
jgi:dihydroxyacid dehydratase/phosphogluconate dehydratase